MASEIKIADNANNIILEEGAHNDLPHLDLQYLSSSLYTYIQIFFYTLQVIIMSSAFFSSDFLRVNDESSIISSSSMDRFGTV